MGARPGAPDADVASCLLLLGGNVGDRLACLRRAVRGLASLPGTRVKALGGVHETAPVGPSSRPYLNAAVLVETSLSPMALLVEAKRLEAEAGRRPAARWTSRPLDVDLLDYAGRRLRTPWLTLPHPRLGERAFALAPARDVAPGHRLPGGATVAARLASLAAGPDVVRPYPSTL